MQTQIDWPNFEYAMRNWRKDAIDKLRSAGEIVKSDEKNTKLLILIKVLNIDISSPPKVENFLKSRLTAKNKKTIPTQKKETNFPNQSKESKIEFKSTSSRKIKSTLPCATNGQKIKEPAKSIKPNGYKQKSIKSEPVNLDNFYESWTWKDLRYQVIKKYGRRCMNCGQSPSRENKVSLHVDHIKPIRKHPELALDINNLQVLCGDCNQGKGFWDETDFRCERINISINISEEKLSALHDFVRQDHNEAILPWVK